MANKYQHQIAQQDQRLQSLDEKLRFLRSSYKIVQRENKSLTALLGLKQAFDEAEPIYIGEPKARRATEAGRQATAIAQLSDWHVGARVDKRKVLGLNSFNPKIAEQRAKAYFRNLLSEVEAERARIPIPHLLLHLGGDLISNQIHEELMETNFMSPVDETLFAERLIDGGLEFLAEHGNFETISVVCNTGNHGRITKKVRVSTQVENSHEYSIYKHLQGKYSDSLFQWKIAESYHAVAKVYGKAHLFHHGHAIRYQGGVGGVTVPLLRYIHRINNVFPYPIVHHWLGHFHQLLEHPAFTINGSLIGYDTYAMVNGFGYEPPRQSMRLFDSRRGFTKSTPIYLD